MYLNATVIFKKKCHDITLPKFLRQFISKICKLRNLRKKIVMKR